MKVSYTTPSGRIQIEQEIAKAKDAFQFIGIIQEMFEEECCGCCKSKNIRSEVREVDDFRYYQLTCQECTARLEFGQHKNEKTLFAKKWDSERKAPMPDAGWFIWQPENAESEKRGQSPYASRPTVAGKVQPKESAKDDVVPW